MPNSNIKTPIFIAGCGRSGTSFLRTVIDAHPWIHIPSESLFLVDYLRYANRLPEPIGRFLFYHEPQLQCWYNGEHYRLDCTPSVIRKIHEEIANRHGAFIWGQKTPRFIRHRQLFEDAFDSVTWLLIYRDPRAVAASMRLSGQHTNSVMRAVVRWRRDNRDIVDFIKHPEKKPDNILLVKYETLIDEFDSTIKNIFEFIGVPPIDREVIEENARPVFFSQSRFTINTIRNGITPDSTRIESWSKVLTSEEIAYIESACAEEMHVMSYKPVTLPAAATPIKLEWGNKCKDIHIVMRYLRYWPTYPLYIAVRKLIMVFFRCLPGY